MNYEKALYRTGWCIFISLLIILMIVRMLPFDYQRYSLPCALHSLTGFYCPGCGGTRAAMALLSGKLIQSFYYHPFIVYVAALYAWFMLSHTMEIVSGGKWKIGMMYRPAYLFAGAGIVVLNCIVRNMLYLVWGIPI